MHFSDTPKYLGVSMLSSRLHVNKQKNYSIIQDKCYNNYKKMR